jgi:hypothetical protein
MKSSLTKTALEAEEDVKHKLLEEDDDPGTEDEAPVEDDSPSDDNDVDVDASNVTTSDDMGTTSDDTGEDVTTSDGTSEPSEDEVAPDSSSDEDEREEEKAAVIEKFSRLDLREAECFGYTRPVASCWTNLAYQAIDLGWPMIDVEALEASLAKNVDNCYLHIATFKLVNVENDMPYVVKFDNNRALWDVEIVDSPGADMSFEEREDFFKSEMMTKVAKTTYAQLLEAKKLFDEVVRLHLDEGELLLVDDVKLDAVMSFLNQERFLENVLSCKHMGF